MLGSDLGRDTDYPEDLPGFLQSVQTVFTLSLDAV